MFQVLPLCDWTTEQAKVKHASRPLRNYSDAMGESMKKSLMGKKDPTVPVINNMAEWFNTYGQSENFFSADSGMDTTGGRDTMYGFVDKKAQGIMSRFERSSRRYGKERSQAVGYKKGGLTA